MDKRDLLKQLFREWINISLDILIGFICALLILGAFFAFLNSIIGLILYEEKFVWVLYTLCSMFVIAPFTVIMINTLTELNRE